jgi:hypothetical protein
MLWLLGLRLAQTCGFGVRPVEVDTRWRRWYLALGLEQTRLEIDDVVAQLVVLRLQRLVELEELLELLDLVLELLDVLFFTLTEGALWRSVQFRGGARHTYLGGAVLCGTLRGGQLSASLRASLARVAVVGVNGALAHLVGLASNCWIDCVRRALLGRVLGQWLGAGLASTGSEEMFS